MENKKAMNEQEGKHCVKSWYIGYTLVFFSFASCCLSFGGGLSQSVTEQPVPRIIPIDRCSRLDGWE